jgi:NADH-quinone oxidoreductase subunit H
MLGKAGFFLFFYVLVRWTLPRFRFDQLMGIAWKVLIPLSIASLIGVMVAREFDMPLVVLPVMSIVLFVAAAALNARRNVPMGVQKTGKIHAPAALANV